MIEKIPQSEDIPRYITKFFDADDLHFFERGSIRFGTLESYGNEENVLQGARLDTGEGHFKTILNSGGAAVTDVKIGPFFIGENVHAVLEENFHIGQLNTYVFCSSIGPYTTALHRSILCRSPEGYPGNPGLRGFVTFDTERLLKAIVKLSIAKFDLPHHALVTPPKTNPIVRWLEGGAIEYGERVRAFNVRTGQRELDWAPYFCKPKFFKPENEYRIVVNKDYPAQPAIAVAPFSIEGHEILEAMCMPPRVISIQERDSWLSK